MPGWEVSPPGIGVLTATVRTTNETLDTTLGSVDEQLQAAVAGTNSGTVQSAMNVFVEAQESDVALIRSRVPAAVGAVIIATNAVQAGDQQMADTTQSEASASFAPPVPATRLSRGGTL